jgi:hypothetical protein
MFGEGGKVFFGNENKYGHVLGPVLCLCGGAHLEGREEIFFSPLRAGLVRPPSLTRLVGLVPSLVSHPGPQQHQGRLHPAVPPFFFFLGGAVGPVTLPSCPVSPSPCGGKAGSEMDHKDLESSNRCPGHKFTTCKYFSNTLYGASFSL